MLHVRPDLREGIVIRKVLGALPEIIKRFSVSAPGCLLEAPAWLDGVARDVNENVLGGQGGEVNPEGDLRAVKNELPGELLACILDSGARFGGDQQEFVSKAWVRHVF